MSENLKQICILNKNGLSFDIQDIIYDIIPFLIELNNKYEIHAYSDNLDSDEKFISAIIIIKILIHIVMSIYLYQNWIL
jgi:hypothetical protein